MTKVRGLTYISLLAVLALSPLCALKVGAITTTSTPDVFITELQTANETASQEFIELYNNTDYDIDFGDTAHSGLHVWKLQFFSSTKVAISGFNWDPKTSGLTTISLARSDGSPSIIAAHSYFLVSTAPSGVTYAPGGVEPDLTYASGHMSDAGGGVQLVDVSGTSTKQVFTVHDHLGWYSPTPSIPLPSGFQLTPPAAGSLQRILSTGGIYFDANGQLLNFVSSTTTTPKEAWATPSPEEPAPDNYQTETVPPADPATPETADDQQTPELPIQITELLPNPASPASDSNDEFLELFNPNDAPVDLTGYSLQTGSTFSHSFTIQYKTIPGHGYLVFTSGSGSLTLANSGGQAQLLDANGQVMASTDAYGQATEGLAWMLSDTGWLWTTSPTPGALNVFSSPLATEIIPTALVKPAPKKTVEKPVAKTSTAKTAGAKTSKAKTSPSSILSDSNAPEVTTLHPSALASVAVLAIGYGAYEYKQDFTNRLRRFRADRANSRKISGKP